MNVKDFFSRLKNPATILGITGLVLNTLVINNINIDSEIIYQTIQNICGILILLGIMNNPDTGGIDFPNPLKKKEIDNDVK